MTDDIEHLFRDQAEGETAEFSVSELVSTAAAHMQSLWQDGVWVVGEVAELKTYARSGHTYMTIKDSKAEVRCVLYQFEAKMIEHYPAVGEEISVFAFPNIYKSKGRFQLSIKNIRVKGSGQLYQQFLELKETLRTKGWFDPENKKQLVTFPSSIAVVVSLEGAAWHDVRTTLAKRFPSIPLKVIPAPAQGTTAATKIAKAVAKADKLGCDVLLLCRGGGSIEDLQAYNDIKLATAVYQATTPVITGIGHETDETIVDYIADRRASTPTAAAVEASPDRQELLRHNAVLQERSNAAFVRFIESTHERIDDAAQELAQSVKGSAHVISNKIVQLIFRLQHRTEMVMRERRDALLGNLSRMQNLLSLFVGAKPALYGLTKRLGSATQHSLSHKLGMIVSCASRIDSLSPQRTLERGYALVTDPTGLTVTSSQQLAVDQEATVGFFDGSLGMKVTNVKRKLPLHLDSMTGKE